ncbi:MAG: hypothetical protein ACT4NV_03365 [Rhodoferax sp.]
MWLGLAVPTGAAAQTLAPQWPGAAAVEWLDAPHKRLRAALSDLLALEQGDGTSARGKNVSAWESEQLRAGAWSARTVFSVVQGRVKRIEQTADAPVAYCEEGADWGDLGRELELATGAAPMVYAPTSGTGAWQQAALWHSRNATVVVYRTLAAEQECQVRVSIQ